MQVERVFVQAVNGVPDDEAFHKAWHGFRKRGLDCVLVTAQAIEGGGLPLTRSTLVAGGIRTVEAAIRQIGMQMPEANNLPDELSRFFGRRVRKTTLDKVRSQWDGEKADPCVLKPLDQNKQFPTIALFDQDDLSVLSTIDGGVRVIVSEYVLFESEWRAFVVEGEVVGLANYQGDFFNYPDPAVITSAIQSYTTAPAAYGIDFGVLTDGTTVIVEANDGYSLGSYSLNSVDYSRLLETRWLELAG